MERFGEKAQEMERVNIYYKLQEHSDCRESLCDVQFNGCDVSKKETLVKAFASHGVLDKRCSLCMTLTLLSSPLSLRASHSSLSPKITGSNS